MKLATTTGDLVYLSQSPAEAVRTFEGTGFKHLDYTFWRLGWGDRPILKDDWMQPVIAAGKEAEKLGFDFVQAHSPGNNCLECDDEEFENVVLGNIRSIEACGYLGIKKLVVHQGCSGDYRFPDGKEKYFEANRRFYERLYPAMEKYGVKVLVENMCGDPENGRYNLLSGRDMADFIDYCGHPLLGACWDTGHGNVMTESAYDDIMALGSRLEALHVQDNFGARDDHLAPYMGKLDIDSVMNALVDGGYTARGGYFTFECDNIISSDSRRDERFPSRAGDVTLQLKKAAVTFLYEIGKAILTAYDLYED